MFSVTVLHDERIVIVAEQRPDSTEEDSFQWMSRVLQVSLTPPGPAAISAASISMWLTLVTGASLVVTAFNQKYANSETQICN